jgi:Ring finger domain
MEDFEALLRLANGFFFLLMVQGSIMVVHSGTCSTTAPHLYRLVVLLTCIYFALLFLPLTCFCLVVCCLPLFIVLFRILPPIAERERRRRRAAGEELIARLPTAPFVPPINGDLDADSCVICLCLYEAEEEVKTLPCAHHYHRKCVDEWLRVDRSCPMCKRDVDRPGISRSTSSSSNSSEDSALTSPV